MSDEFDELPVPVVRTDRPLDNRGQASGSMTRIPEFVGDVYLAALLPLRAKLLECLLQPVGTLGLMAIATGAFGELLLRRRFGPLGISPEDASRFTVDHVRELASFVEQCAPETCWRIAMLLAESPTAMTGLTASAFLLALRAWRGRWGSALNEAVDSATPVQRQELDSGPPAIPCTVRWHELTSSGLIVGVLRRRVGRHLNFCMTVPILANPRRGAILGPGRLVEGARGVCHARPDPYGRLGRGRLELELDSA
jgi:hypothetical protein